jgi:poly(beta-D-mannuronate) lyase
VRTADPLITDDGPVHRLAAGSPAIDAGTGNHPFVTDDMDGQARVDGADVGADERSSSAGTRGPLTANDVGPEAA